MKFAIELVMGNGSWTVDICLKNDVI